MPAQMRLEWRPDTLTNILFRPSFGLTKSDGKSTSASAQYNDDPYAYSDSPLSDAAISQMAEQGKMVNTSRTGQISHSEAKNVGAMLQLNRKLGSRGRNVTLRGDFSYSDTDSKALSTNNVRLYQQKDRFGNDSTYQTNRFNVTPTKQYSYAVQTTYRLTDWLPTTKKEIELRGWDSVDVILFSADAYVDHPSFGAAVIGRTLEAAGYTVAIVPQPDWHGDFRDFKKLGRPNLFFGIAPGCMDSMVNKYTAGKRLRLSEFRKELNAAMDILQMDHSYADRDLNVGFSGGEKKKAEILQLLMLKPALALLDETDSGLDVDAVKTVANGIKAYHNDTNALIIITHNAKILEGLQVDYVHVLDDARIVRTGNGELVSEIIEEGFAALKEDEAK